MSGVKSKITFVVSAILYVVFNLRLGTDALTSTKATLWQIATTAPYVAGMSYIIIALLQYMSDGAKVPWDRRFRIFFAIGIIAGLLNGIYEYGGAGIGGQ